MTQRPFLSHAGIEIQDFLHYIGPLIMIKMSLVPHYAYIEIEIHVLV